MIDVCEDGLSHICAWLRKPLTETLQSCSYLHNLSYYSKCACSEQGNCWSLELLFFFFFYISAWTKTLWSWLMTNAQHYLTKPWSGNKQTTAKQVIMIVQKRICKAKWVSLCVCAYVCGCLWDHWYECINICVLLEQWGGTNKSDAVRMEGWHCKRWYREKKRKINNLVNKWEGRERRK